MSKKELKDENIEPVEAAEAAEAVVTEEADEKETQIAELKEKNLRLMAEFENYKKRTQKEKEAAFEYSAANTIASVLPILDTLELSTGHEITDIDKFKEGMELLLKQFNETLGKLNVTEIENKIFDPELHNAVMRDEESDLESGSIVEVFQKGYKINDRVIRHSMVKVKA